MTGHKEESLLLAVTQVVLTPDLHDGRLTSIALVGTALEIGCNSVAGTAVVIRMEGLHRLRADRFLQGNVIFEIRLFVGADIPLDLFRRAFGEEDGVEVPWLNGQIERAQRESWKLLLLDSSYGCELVAIASGACEIRARS